MKTIHGLKIPSSLDDICTQEQMALIVYDMQVGILSQIGDGERITDKVHEALSVARSHGMRVIFMRHLSLPKEMMGVAQYRMAMAWQRVQSPEDVKPWFLRDSSASQIVDMLAPRPSEAIFDKIAMSAFEGTPLATTLRDCGIIAVAIAGVAMEIGIEPTVRHATDLGFIPVVLADACGAGHQDAADRSLETLRFAGDAIITDVSTFAATIRSSSDQAAEAEIAVAP
jgi:biuret amidohydrolase